jgi:hypothetical protein
LNRKCIAEGDTEDSRSTEKTSPPSNPQSPQVAPQDGVAGQSGGNREALNAVELALADAITRASAAGRFDVVAQLAREIEARRLASSNVVPLGAARARRGR